MAGRAAPRGGRTPDPSSLRSAAADWTTLPASGREGPPPGWPLPEQTVREAELWDELWSMPQAIEWERTRQDLLVALYTRRFVEAEVSGSPAALSTLVRQLADELLLTPSSLLRAHTRIGDVEPEHGDDEVEDQEVEPSVLDRLTVVPGGAA